MYELLGLSLALAALLTINVLVTLAATIIWRGLDQRARHWTARRRAGWLFALRALPAFAALGCVLALLIPAWTLHEPYQTAEIVSFRLAALALLSMAGIALAIGRGLASWIVTRRLVKDWLGNATLVRCDQPGLPVYRLAHRFPVIAIVGAWRPRLFIADQVFRTLSQAELAAALAHECGHLQARDNLKRAVLRACRDALSIVPCGRALDRAWAEESEAAADEYAAHFGSAAALDLAAALVKIARLIPAGAHPALPAGALLIGHEAGSVAARVQRLTELASTEISPTSSQKALRSLFPLCFSGGVICLAFIATNTQALSVIHSALELIVSALQ